MRRFESRATSCERIFAGVCVGAGWLLGKNDPLPDCGSGGAYQSCEYDASADTCKEQVLMLLQSCR